MGGKLTNGEKHSRGKVEALFLDVRRDMAMLGDLVEVDDSMLVFVAGSLRRGCSECGDLDIVVVVDDDTSREVVMAAFGVDPFTQSGKLRCGCSFVSDGVQVDIAFARHEEAGAMMMYLTGPWELNVNQRAVASRKGLLLNQTGLYRPVNGNGEEPDYVPASGKYKGQGFVRIAGETEQEVYAALGMEYLKPEERQQWSQK